MAACIISASWPGGPDRAAGLVRIWGVVLLCAVRTNIYVLHKSGRPESDRVQAAYVLSRDSRVNQRQYWDICLRKPLPGLARYVIAEALTAEGGDGRPAPMAWPSPRARLAWTGSGCFWFAPWPTPQARVRWSRARPWSKLPSTRTRQSPSGPATPWRRGCPAGCRGHQLRGRWRWSVSRTRRSPPRRPQGQRRRASPMPRPRDALGSERATRKPPLWKVDKFEGGRLVHE